MCLNHALAGYDPEQANAFAERLLTAFNGGALCLMTSIGHRTGLFDTMAHTGGTSEDIASAASLNERYVREWLAAMATARVVDYDPVAGRYSLPPEHAAFLTRAATPENIAVFAQYIAVLGQVEDDIVDCFRHGGGVPYARFPRFHAVMAEDSGQSVLPALFDHILPLVPNLIERLQQGIEVLDVGCGSGRAVNEMAAHFPASRFTGFDLSNEAITQARAEAQSRGLRNMTFEARDLSDFDTNAEQERFDFITTFDAVHDQARPRAVLKGIHRALRRDGVYLMQDIRGSSDVQNNLDHPLGTLLYTVSTMHCMTVSLAQGGEGLGTLWGREKAEELLREAGFRSIEVHALEHDIQNDYYVIRK